eukprot:CAMPEP_0185850994 /NCGR_PEP_ID=MMETSP1354-20130828/4903_1 /TAXON_ID=708628 /ORGANISM="Erythrolobus madagascarensis, Strain CCMP3276" /LENGTH=735 /DNA_ID=CAMNT_0028551731 /DNA_START=184 /DNA_END=2391 /DNA_ORIENTATION=-
MHAVASSFGRVFGAPKVKTLKIVPEFSEHEHERTSATRLFHLFFKVATPFWRTNKNARWATAFVLILMLLNTGFNVAMSFCARAFWDALSDRDVPRFHTVTYVFILITLLSDPVYVYYNYCRNVLSTSLRQYLANAVMDMYYDQRSYYVIEATRKVDNPDQRLSEDVKGFAEMSILLISHGMTSLLDVIAFSYILLTIYPPLFAFLVVYASVGTASTFFIGRKLILLEFQNLRSEADLRFSLMRVRANAESIAFYRGEAREEYNNRKMLFIAIENDLAVFRWQRNLDYFVQLYTYLVQIIPIIVLAPSYFANRVTLGSLQQAWSAFNSVLRDLSFIVMRFDEVSKMSAGLDRLGEFIEFLEARATPENPSPFAARARESKRPRRKTKKNTKTKRGGGGESSDAVAATKQKEKDLEQPDETCSVGTDTSTVSTGVTSEVGGGVIQIIEDDTVSLETQDLTLFPPDDPSRVLFRGLTMSLPQNARLLIVGPSGCGKSSLLRALAGLWQSGAGSIRIAPLRDAFFLPQRPYCTLGTLREQLTYPRKLSEISPDALYAAVARIDDRAASTAAATAAASSTATGVTAAAAVAASRSSSSSEQDDTFAETLDRFLEHTLVQVSLPLLSRRMGGLSTERDWSTVLSLGEQQRLAFGRLLVSQALGFCRLSILDEATSALDLRSEAFVYSMLRPPFISVGHRPSLLQFHDAVLRLSPDGAQPVLTAVTPEQREAALRAEVTIS